MDFEAIASYFEINTRSRERRGKSYVSRKEKMKWHYILKTWRELREIARGYCWLYFNGFENPN